MGLARSAAPLFCTLSQFSSMHPQVVSWGDMHWLTALLLNPGLLS